MSLSEYDADQSKSTHTGNRKNSASGLRFERESADASRTSRHGQSRLAAVIAELTSNLREVPFGSRSDFRIARCVGPRDGTSLVPGQHHVPRSLRVLVGQQAQNDFIRVHYQPQKLMFR